MDFLGPTVHFIDTSIHDQLLCLRGNEVIVIFKLITGFGNWQFILLSLFILTLVLHLRSLQRYIFSLYIGLISSTIVTFLMKLFVARPCPIDGLLTENDFSFPSGHATVAVAFYGFLIYIVLKEVQTKKRNMYVLLLCLVILLIGFSRLYLGVHYMSDVIAGYVVGSLGVLLGTTFYRNHLPKR